MTLSSKILLYSPLFLHLHNLSTHRQAVTASCLNKLASSLCLVFLLYYFLPSLSVLLKLKFFSILTAFNHLCFCSFLLYHLYTPVSGLLESLSSKIPPIQSSIIQCKSSFPPPNSPLLATTQDNLVCVSLSLFIFYPQLGLSMPCHHACPKSH